MTTYPVIGKQANTGRGVSAIASSQISFALRGEMYEEDESNLHCFHIDCFDHNLNSILVEVKAQFEKDEYRVTLDRDNGEDENDCTAWILKIWKGEPALVQRVSIEIEFTDGKTSLLVTERHLKQANDWIYGCKPRI